MTITTGYAARLQPTSIQARSLMSIRYPRNAVANNGNLASRMVTAGGSSSVPAYSYDVLNCLASAIETKFSTRTWHETLGYDWYGNQWVSGMYPGGLEGASTPTESSNFKAFNTRLPMKGNRFDSTGESNQTSIDGYSWAYDAENRLRISTLNRNTTTYHYDANGRRMSKLDPSGTMIYAYDARGQLATKYSTMPNAAAIRQYVQSDALGWTRLVAGGGGAVVICHDCLPFRAEILASVDSRPSCHSGSGSLTHWFTGKERDAETGLDWFATRYMSSAQGRFTSPDSLLSSGRPEQPQSWNRYAYVLNNPLRFTDPTGQQEQGPCGPQQGDCTEVLQKTAKAGVQGAQNAVRNTINAPIKLVNLLSGPVGGFVAPLPLPEKTSGDKEIDAGSKVAEFTVATAPLLLGGGGTASTIANQVPGSLARVVPGDISVTTLGPPNAADVFVTATSDIRGLNAAGISERLTIPRADSFKVLEFSSGEVSGIASPINRVNPGFIGGGRTAGGAREFVIPNGPIPPGTMIRVVR